MRVLYQSMTELESLPDYAAFLRDHIAVSCPEGVTIELAGVTPGTYGGLAPMEVLRYPLGFHRALGQVLDRAEEAASLGFDAFLMGSFVAPFLREARCAVDIPVTSMAESVLLMAHTLSHRVGLVCISTDQVGTANDLITSLRLTPGVVGAFPIDIPVTETEVSSALGSRGGALADSFDRAARLALDSGADLIVPAEGILSEVVRSNEILVVDGVPVVDCVEVSISHTVALTRLARSGAVGIGRRTYPKIPS